MSLAANLALSLVALTFLGVAAGAYPGLKMDQATISIRPIRDFARRNRFVAEDLVFAESTGVLRTAPSAHPRNLGYAPLIDE